MPMRDLAYACRTLRKSPAFAATAALTIAFGVGASTAVFSVVDAVLVRPLPYRDPDRLVTAWMDFRKLGMRDLPFSNGDFFDLRDGTRDVFEELGAVFTFRVIVPREDGRPERIYKAQVTTNFFRMMGARIVLGRDFTDMDGQPQPAEPQAGLPVGSGAILSYDYWQRRYGGSAGVIGQEMIHSRGRGPRIIGVLAPGFQLFFPPGANTEGRPDVWIANNAGYERGPAGSRVIGRLKDGVTLGQAQEQVELVTADLRRRFTWHAGSDMHVRIEPLRGRLVAEVRPALVALMGAGICLLLIAWANVANLLLVRASYRQRELAVRAALGGSRRRLLQQMLAEAVLLSGSGALLGVGLAWICIHALLGTVAANLGNVPQLESVAIDGRVLAFAAVAALAATAILGLLPAWRAARPEVMQVLRGGGRGTGPGGGRTLRNSVVVVEVALSFVLLIGSGLMLRSFRELLRIDPGYGPGGVLTFLLVRDWPWPEMERGQVLLREVQSRLRALPGVENASACAFLPLSGPRHYGVPWTTDQAPADRRHNPAADLQGVLPGYFETLRTPLLEGRTFTEDDNHPGRKVVIIDQLLAAKAFPNQSAVGKRLRIRHRDAPGGGWVEVIGVVQHQRLASLAEAGREQLYLTDALSMVGVSRHWAIRTSGDPAKVAAAVRDQLIRLDPQLLMLELQPMEALVERSQAKTRLALLLLGTFAAIAALLAAVGLYGVLSTLVRHRTAEIGVRMALGAPPAWIFRLVVGHGLRLSAAGVAIGLLAAFVLTRMMTSMLVGVTPTDPTTFTVMAVIFFAIASLACWLPARRAAALEPVAALREE